MYDVYSSPIGLEVINELTKTIKSHNMTEIKNWI